MPNDRIRREDVDDYSGADPERQRDVNEDWKPGGGGEEIRGIADEGDDELDDMEDLEEDEEDEY